MYLNEFADGLTPKDMTATDEFASLLDSAADLGIAHDRSARYLSRHTVVRGQRFHFLEWGDPANPPIVLLHGGNQSSHSWDLVSLHLADRYHVYALDQRGHGDSEWNRELDYSMAAMAADARAFIADQGLVDPIVFGHSMGGRITLTMAVAEPTLAKALVIVDVGPEISAEGAKTIQNFVIRNLEFDDLEVFLDNVEKYDPFRSRVHIERTMKYNVLRRVDGKYISKVDHRRIPVRNRDLTLDQMATLDLPVLVVRGEQSNILEPDAAQRFVDALPQGRLVTIPNCGHNVHSGNTGGFLDAVREFLDHLAEPIPPGMA
ncbi:MAG: alpha/beta hydrolase [Acidimicrobiales bacterium]|nr:alpha/beta hydrolase [Acidimicrobiales bacterium]